MERTAAVRLTAAVGNYKASLAQAAAATRELKREIGDTAKSSKADMQQLGQAMTVMGGAVVGAFGLAGRAAVQFESSFAGVRKTVNASEPEFARLSAGFRQMAKDIPTSVNELNAVGEAAGQLGIETASILGFSRTMADLGVTTNLSAQEAATSLARLANITQMPQAAFDRLGSTVVALGNNFATTEAEIVEMGLRLAGAGKQIGLTEAEILGLGAALSSVGIEAQAGGTALSKVMIDIASEVANAGDNLELFARTAGMSAQQFSAAWREDAAGALVEFVEGLGNLEEQGGSTLQTLEELGITEVRMRDALLRASGAGDLLRDSLEQGNQAWEDNIALAKEAAQRYETTESRLRLAGNAINDLGISVGQVATPLLGEAADVVAGFASGMAALPGPVLAVGTGVIALGGAATLAAGGFLLLAPRIAATKVALDALSVSMPRSVGMVRGLASALMGPWGIALAAGTVALGVWSKNQAEAERRTQAWKDTLDETTGAVTDLTREMAALDLAQSGARAAARELGVSFEDVVDAAMGNDAALGRVTAAIEAQRRATAADIDVTNSSIAASMDQNAAANTLAVSLGIVTAEVADVVAAKREELEILAESEGRYLDVAHAIRSGLDPATASMIVNAQRAADASEDAAGGIGSMGEEAGETAEQLEGMLDALDRLVGLLFDTEDAELRVLDALDDVTESVKDNGRSLDKHTEKGRANIRAISGAAEAIFGHAEALIEEGRSLEQVLPVMDGHIEALKEEMRQAGFTEDQIAELIDRYGLVPTRIATAIAADTAEAERALASLFSSIAKLPTSLNIRAHLIGPVGAQQHAGGLAGTGPARSMLGLAPDEVPAVLQKGEFVLSRDMVRMLRGLPRFHSGGMAGPFDAGLVGSIVSGAMGGSSSDIQAALDRVERLMGKWQRLVEEEQRAAQRAGLTRDVSDARAALRDASPEQRAMAERRLADAIAAVEEHDRAAARAAEQRAIADDRAALEVELRTAEEREAADARIAANRDEWMFARLTSDQQLSLLDDRLAAETMFTDAWMDLSDQRQRILDAEADAARRAADDELAVLNRMLDETDRIQGQLAAAERRWHADREAERARHVQALADENDRHAEAVGGAVARRRDRLRTGIDADGFQTGVLVNTIRGQTANLQEWTAGLEQLRARGVSEDVIEALGLGEGPEALGRVRSLLAGTEAELADLNRAVADQMAAIDARVAAEQTDRSSLLGTHLEKLQQDHLGRLEALESEHFSRLGELEESWLAEQAELRNELAAVGSDQGRAWAESIAAGIASGIPAIEEQARRAQEAMRSANETEARASQNTVAQMAAQMRADLGLDPDPISDLAWAEGVAAGTHDLANLERRLREKARLFDDGGVWRSGTLGMNRSGQDEYVFTQGQLAALGGGPSSITVVMEVDGEVVGRIAAPVVGNEVRVKTGWKRS